MLEESWRYASSCPDEQVQAGTAVVSQEAATVHHSLPHTAGFQPYNPPRRELPQGVLIDGHAPETSFPMRPCQPPLQSFTYQHPVVNPSLNYFPPVPHRVDDRKQNVIRADILEKSEETHYLVRFVAAAVLKEGQPELRVVSEVSLPVSVYLQLPSNMLTLSTLRHCLEKFVRLTKGSNVTKELQWIIDNISSKTADAMKDRSLV